MTLNPRRNFEQLGTAAVFFFSGVKRGATLHRILQFYEGSSKVRASSYGPQEYRYLVGDEGMLTLLLLLKKLSIRPDLGLLTDQKVACMYWPKKVRWMYSFFESKQLLGSLFRIRVINNWPIFITLFELWRLVGPRRPRCGEKTRRLCRRGGEEAQHAYAVPGHDP